MMKSSAKTDIFLYVFTANGMPLLSRIEMMSKTIIKSLRTPFEPIEELLVMPWFTTFMTTPVDFVITAAI